MDSSKLTHQRRLANMRERRRMLLINRGFELLRSKLPAQGAKPDSLDDCVNCFNDDDLVRLKRGPQTRLTKADILRFTIRYIQVLSRLVKCSDAADNARIRCDIELGDVKRTAKPIKRSHKICDQRIAKAPRRKCPSPTSSGTAIAVAQDNCTSPQTNRILMIASDNGCVGYTVSWSNSKSDQSSSEDSVSKSNRDICFAKLWTPVSKNSQ